VIAALGGAKERSRFLVCKHCSELVVSGHLTPPPSKYMFCSRNAFNKA